MIGRLAIDSNAVIAFRENVYEFRKLIEEADLIVMPVTVLGELL